MQIIHCCPRENIEMKYVFSTNNQLIHTNYYKLIKSTQKIRISSKKGIRKRLRQPRFIFMIFILGKIRDSSQFPHSQMMSVGKKDFYRQDSERFPISSNIIPIGLSQISTLRRKAAFRKRFHNQSS